jgi:S-adenosylmethionine:tRNA ribosyltransferase-isomerase
VLVSDFNYDLPDSRIAQEPLADRAGSRLLHLNRTSGTWRDRTFRDFPELLRPDDILVVNNTKVFPARLFARRRGARAQPLSPNNPASKEFLQGRNEILLTRQLQQDPNDWECLVRPGRKIGVGEHLLFGDPPQLEAEVIRRGEFGERVLRFATVPDFFSALEGLGHVPLPPYIAREDQSKDRERYQTVYARERGSVAAPTAGLHFTSEIFRRVRDRGIEIAEITLHVGLGTFQPVHAEQVEDHRLHSEAYSISPEAAEKINAARDRARRVVAVGTTTVRTLEYAARLSSDGRILPTTGEANLFIYPSFEFRVVSAVLTNFHLPQSTLLMLVAAFGGRDHVLAAYRHAVEAEYRFYSYGDCMFVE